MESKVSHDKGDILHDWLRTPSQEISVVLRKWYYSVSASSPRGKLLSQFKWDGTTTAPSRKEIEVIGEFIIMDEWLLRDWSGHPFEVGEVTLFDEKNGERDPWLSIEVRVSELCCAA
jgi:hypothetical protein